VHDDAHEEESARESFEGAGEPVHVHAAEFPADARREELRYAAVEPVCRGRVVLGEGSAEGGKTRAVE